VTHRDRSDEAMGDPAVVDGLVQLSFAVHSILGRVAAAHELSMTQLRLLGILRDREPGMMQLAELLGLDKSSVTGLIDRAERRGLVRRASRPEDGRAVRVAITPAGRDVAHRGSQEIARQLGGLLAELTAGEQSSFASMARRLIGPARAVTVPH
jgi:DNA-binding MarR family transcriptional regulator